MAKIGTAHVEIKPVLNDEALEQIATRIEAAVRAGVEAGMRAAQGGIDYNLTMAGEDSPFLVYRSDAGRKSGNR